MGSTWLGMFWVFRGGAEWVGEGWLRGMADRFRSRYFCR